MIERAVQATMTGKQRVLNAIKRESVDRVPWVPFVGCHGGALIDATATDYLKDANLMVQGAGEAVKYYQPDGLPVVFDLQIEAEVLGCHLEWADDNPPAVTSHPLADGVGLDELRVPGPDEGRIAVALDAAKKMKQAYPDIALYGLITGPFTLALHLLGTDIFMRMFDDVDYVHKLMKFCQDVGTAMASYYIQAGCEVIAIVDPMTSQIGPDQFGEFVQPFITPIFDSIREQGALGSFFVCGHAQQNIPVMCECHCDNVSVDENIPLDFVRDHCLKNKVSFGGNLQLTTVLLLGTPLDAQKNAVECLEIGGKEGFLLAPGCDLPYATPIANLKAIVEPVQDEYQREVIKNMVQEDGDQDELDMSQYGQLDKVIVDIITLDSEACAPCQYMVDAVRKIAPEFDGIVEWREHKIKNPESLTLMNAFMVRNIPTICIDGKITFVSRIPPRNELIAAIQKRVNEKLRRRIQNSRGELLILGADNEKTRELYENAQKAVTELGADVAIKCSHDRETLADFGLLESQTPVVIRTAYKLKSTNSVPDVDIIKEWVKEI